MVDGFDNVQNAAEPTSVELVDASYMFINSCYRMRPMDMVLHNKISEVSFLVSIFLSLCLLLSISSYLLFDDCFCKLINYVNNSNIEIIIGITVKRHRRSRTELQEVSSYGRNTWNA